MLFSPRAALFPPQHFLSHEHTSSSPALFGDSEGIRHMIVEVTPRARAMMAAKGKDWSTSNLKRTLTGRKIMAVGWMMPDQDHCNASENTNPGGAHDWRATCWEIHPISALGPAQ
jgi:hypothetical protein